MIERIEIGDLVMIVRGHECLVRHHGGRIFTVAGFIQPKNGGYRCQRCHKNNAGPDEIGATFSGHPQDGAIPLSWLKRIPPLTEPETTTEEAAE